MKRTGVTRDEFDAACEAVWTEIQYQDSLSRRTDDEADSVPSFLTLGRRYNRLAEEAWADNPGTVQDDGSVQVEDALHGVRKLTAIYLRAMVYCGVRNRKL